MHNRQRKLPVVPFSLKRDTVHCAAKSPCAVPPIVYHGSVRLVKISLRLLRLLASRPALFFTLMSVVRSRRTYLDFSALLDLVDATATVERRAISGAILEAGCALGGSAIVLAATKQPARAMAIYDTFELNSTAWRTRRRRCARALRGHQSGQGAGHRR